MRFLAFALLAVMLVGCLPAVSPNIARDGDTALITIQPARSVYDAIVVVLGARTSDSRCTLYGDDLSCEVGNVPARTTTSILVTGAPPVYCVVYGYLEESLVFSSYRAFPCSP